MPKRHTETHYTPTGRPVQRTVRTEANITPEQAKRIEEIEKFIRTMLEDEDDGVYSLARYLDSGRQLEEAELQYKALGLKLEIMRAYHGRFHDKFRSFPDGLVAIARLRQAATPAHGSISVAEEKTAEQLEYEKAMANGGDEGAGDWAHDIPQAEMQRFLDDNA